MNNNDLVKGNTLVRDLKKIALVVSTGHSYAENGGVTDCRVSISLGEIGRVTSHAANRILELEKQLKEK